MIDYNWQIVDNARKSCLASNLLSPFISKGNGLWIGYKPASYNWMPLHNQTVTGIRVLDTAEEGATAIETMVNGVIKEVAQQGIPIIDIQVTDNNCFLILGEKKSD